MNPPPSEWVEISIQIQSVALEALSAFLFDLECEGLLMEESGVKAYLALPQDLELIRQRILVFLQGLKGIFPEIDPPSLSLTRIENRNWGESWRRFFRPEKVTPNLWIVPPWETLRPEWEGEIVLMDPGPAFGTGQHATTRMCLLAMERTPRPPGWSLLDAGTGSGILSIYGVKLGAGRVVGADIDPEALRWAERNIELNGVSGRIELTDRPVQDLEERFSIVVANLTMGPILELLPAFERLLEEDGRLILSGLLGEQAGRVRQALRSQGFFLGRILKRGEWACVITRRRGKRSKDE